MKPAGPRKGRGAPSNLQGRFERWGRAAIDDGWSSEEEEALPPLKTEVTLIQAKSILSRNASPDLSFVRSINPYQGCEHGCVYCVHGETPVLMADGSTRSIAEVSAGDVLYGTARQGWYRRYVRSRVLAHWSVIKPAYRITLEDGTSLVAGPDHRFLTERGWKFVSGAEQGRARRPHLTVNNKLMGTGAFARPPVKNSDYQIGYLCGVIRGDGLLAFYHYQRAGRTNGDQHQFRLALCDVEALLRTQDYLRRWQIDTQQFVFQKAVAGRRLMHAIRTQARPKVEQIRSLIAWPTAPSREWSAGFLAGIYDAEGSYSNGILRLSNTDSEIVDWIARCLRAFDFRFVVEHVHHEIRKPIDQVRLLGGLREHLRFFHSVDPVIVRKRDISGQAVKSEARLGVVSIEALGRAMRLYDITTDSGDFIANGVISHNCYARPSHAYFGLSPGLDFESKLFAKANAAALLRNELSAPGYRPDVISVGANTDPYQPVERELEITRSVLEVLSECEHPFGIVTKSALIERDIDLLAPMAEKNLARAFVSVTNLDNSLARRLEPRASAPLRRLEAIRRLTGAGIPVGVMVAPVLPFLTDRFMEEVLERAREAGANTAGYVLLRLPHEVAPLFKAWLEVHYPMKAAHIMSLIHQMRGGRDYDSTFGVRHRGTGTLAELIARRFHLACERLGFNRERPPLDTARFRPPKATTQLDMF